MGSTRPSPPPSAGPIASRTLLVAFEGSSPEAVSKLLECIFDGPIAGLASPMPLRSQVPQMPFHKGTELYLRRNEPIPSPELASSIGKIGGGSARWARASSPHTAS